MKARPIFRYRSEFLVAGLVAGWSWLAAPAVQGELILSYDAGIAAAAGVSGAADPTTQGWTFNGTGSGYANGYDSGDGGWRTLDGTTGNLAFYGHSLSLSDFETMDAAEGWEVTWTLAMDKDALLEGGGGVIDYYTDVPSRQGALSMIVDRDDEYRFWLIHQLSPTGELLIEDNSNNTDYSTGVFITNGWPNFVTLSLSYDNDTGTATLDHLTGTSTISSFTADPNESKVWMGSVSSGDQGSAIWNELSLSTVVPEPTSLAMLVLGGGLIGVAARHCRRRPPPAG